MWTLSSYYKAKGELMPYRLVESMIAGQLVICSSRSSLSLSSPPPACTSTGSVLWVPSMATHYLISVHHLPHTLCLPVATYGIIVTPVSDCFLLWKIGSWPLLVGHDHSCRTRSWLFCAQTNHGLFKAIISFDTHTGTAKLHFFFLMTHLGLPLASSPDPLK